LGDLLAGGMTFRRRRSYPANTSGWPLAGKHVSQLTIALVIRDV
jgi:hypothetical protein